MGVGAARAFSAPIGAEAESQTNVAGGFAAMLGLVAQSVTPASAPKSAPVAGIDALAGASLETEANADGEDRSENPDGLAVAINAIVPFDTSVPVPEAARPLLDDVLASMNTLKSSIEAGQPLDPELLVTLDAQLDKLGAALGVDLKALPTSDELAALIDKPLAADAALSTKLVAGLAPVAEVLIDGEAGVPADAPEAVALGKAVGEKLAALLAALDGGAVSKETLAQMGLVPTVGEPEAKPDDALEAAIAKLLAPADKLDASLTAPVLAKPALKLTEPVLAGAAAADAAPVKADAAAPSADTAEPALAVDTKSVVAPATDTGRGSGQDAPAERKPHEADKTETKAAPAIAAAVDTKSEIQVPGQPQQHAARADAVAAPHVVQAGYQTSQQQLNLPQIAFEMARQAGDGNTRFQMRLDPAELGRIDVRLDIDSTGQVNARLTVEKAETLDLMQRDQRALERALAQAGLDSSKTTLEFSLRQNNSNDNQQQAREQRGMPGQTGSGDTPTETPPTINLYRASLSASGVNILA